MPFDLAAGSGGPAVLADIAVSAGDVITLEFISPISFAPFVGVDLTITAASTTTCDLTLDYAGGVLTLDFELGTSEPATWNVFLSAGNLFQQLWSIPLPAFDPISFPITIPNFPSIGSIGSLTTLVGPGLSGIVCSDWEVIDTGAPTTPLTTPGLLRDPMLERR